MSDIDTDKLAEVELRMLVGDSTENDSEWVVERITTLKKQIKFDEDLIFTQQKRIAELEAACDERERGANHWHEKCQKLGAALRKIADRKMKEVDKVLIQAMEAWAEVTKDGQGTSNLAIISMLLDLGAMRIKELANGQGDQSEVAGSPEIGEILSDPRLPE